jgi:hypothetical protein
LAVLGAFFEYLMGSKGVVGAPEVAEVSLPYLTAISVPGGRFVHVSPEAWDSFGNPGRGGCLVRPIEVTTNSFPRGTGFGIEGALWLPWAGGCPFVLRVRTEEGVEYYAYQFDRVEVQFLRELGVLMPPNPQGG